MKLNVAIEKNVLIFGLYGELDSHTYENIRADMDTSICRYKYDKVIFDFTNLTFMDSTGIGMLIGRYKILKGLQKPCYILNANRSITKILQMSGVFTIIRHIENKGEIV